MDSSFNYFYNFYNPQYTIQNIGCNFNVIQPNDFSNYQPQQFYSNSAPSQGNLNQHNYDFNSNDQFRIVNPLQPLVKSERNYQNQFIQPNYLKSNNDMFYCNNNIEPIYSNESNYHQTKLDIRQFNTELDPILMHPPGSLLPTVDYLEVKPRKTHANCSTLLYNRKSTSTNNNTPRKFKCTFINCNKAYMKSSHLKAHIRIHSGEKPHICKFVLPDNTICNETFVRSDQLTRHRRRHENDKPFSCVHCNKQFYRSDHCKTHQERCRLKKDDTNIL